MTTAFALFGDFDSFHVLRAFRWIVFQWFGFHLFPGGFACSDMLSVVSGHFFGFKCMLSNWRTYDVVVNSNSV